MATIHDLLPAERYLVEEISVHIATPNDLFSRSEKIISWFRAAGARKVAIYFDLDVWSPREIQTLYFSRPLAGPDAFHGIPQG